MPRIPRISPPDLPVHVIQRGNNRQDCFLTEPDRKAYAHWLHRASVKFEVQVHAWVFMTNHVHLLVTPLISNGVSRMMQHLGRYYVPYFNNRYRRTGTLYEGRFRSNIVQSSGYFLTCQRYIEMNPVRAGMVADPLDYPWSSHRCHALGHTARMWTPHVEYLSLGETESFRLIAYRKLFRHELDADVISEIRHSVNTGLALGSERYRNQLEQLTGQRQFHFQPGPKSKRGTSKRK